MDAATQTIVENIIRRERRSVLQYVSEAFPWTAAGEQPALAQLQKLIGEENQAIGKLMQLCARQRHTLPYVGAFPMNFTTINFLSLEHILPLLVRYEAQAIADLERDLAAIGDGETRDQVRDILTMKQRHLAELSALAAAHPETYSTVRGRAS